tara:strand:+ start:643 stop:1944 length:1302 start_codon:yes stop_codon:yes gene_type:complete
MAGKILVKNVGGGLRGSTSGLRFNPREAPEFVEEDRTYARGDEPEKKVLEEEKKQRERHHRHKQIAGLQHLSLTSKKRRNSRGDDARNDEELSELTGPASSTGYPLDVSTGAKTGGGSAMGGNPVNIMTSNDRLTPFDILTKNVFERKNEAEPLRVDKPFQSTMGQPGVMTERPKDETTETSKFRADPSKRRGKLRVFGRNPERHSTIGGMAKRTVAALKNSFFNRITQLRLRGSGRPKISWDPRMKNSSILHQDAQRRGPVMDAGVVVPFQTGKRETNLNHSGRGRSFYRHQKALHQPRLPKTPMGKRFAQKISSFIAPKQGPKLGTHMNLGFGKPSPSFAKSFDMLAKAQLSHSDLAEFKWLIRELRRILRGGAFAKSLEDAEHDEERPTPNAHRLTTSSPTGATEVDPDDDPRYWGAHPIGLLVARRGHM